MTPHLRAVPTALSAETWTLIDGLLKRGCELFIICDVLRAEHHIEIDPHLLDFLLWRRLGRAL